LQHLLRGRASQFRAIREAYCERGLGPDFDRYVVLHFPRYIAATAKQRLRMRLGLTQLSPVFEPDWREQVERR
jgi:hypothetical protein